MRARAFPLRGWGAEPGSWGAPRVRGRQWQVCSRSSEVWSCQSQAADAGFALWPGEFDFLRGRLVLAREVFPRGFGEIMKQLPTRHPRSLSQSDLSMQSPGGRGTRCGRGCSHWSEANPELLGGSARRGVEPARQAGKTWQPEKSAGFTALGGPFRKL